MRLTRLRRLRPRFTLLLPIGLVGLAASTTLIAHGHYLLGPLTFVGTLVWLIEDQRFEADRRAQTPCRSCGGRGWRPSDVGPRVCPDCQGADVRRLDPAAIALLSEEDLALAELVVKQGGAVYDVKLFQLRGAEHHQEREAIEGRLLALVACGLLERHFRELRGDKPMDAWSLYRANDQQVAALNKERTRRAQALLPGNRSRLSPLAGGER